MQNEENILNDKTYTLKELQEMVNNINHSEHISLINRIYQIVRKNYLNSFKRLEFHPITKEEHQKRTEEQELLKNLYNEMIIMTEKKYNQEHKNLKKDRDISFEMNSNGKRNLYKKRKRKR